MNKQKINQLLSQLGLNQREYIPDEVDLLTKKDFKRLCFEIKNNDTSDIYVVIQRKFGYIIELSKVDDDQDINFVPEREYLKYCDREDLESRKEDRKNYR